jgi:hypothetical protein
VVQFDGAAPQNGDVEIDIRAPDWRAHHHDVNPAYRRVILHAVWEADAPAGGLPTLTLRERLDAPLEKLLAWMDLDLEPPALALGLCHRPLRHLPDALFGELLEQAARIRLQRKGCELAARARQTGWEQALWEGLCAALGYRHNVWPMRRLAEHFAHLRHPTQVSPDTPLRLQARLLGLSSLLPHDSSRQTSAGRAHLRALWDHWWRDRDELVDLILPKFLWRLGGVRPANHPQRRIALAAHWLTESNLPHRLEAWFQSRPTAAEAEQSLREILGVPNDPFWSWHWTLESPRLRHPQSLLGQARVTDLAVNVILPWFWTRAFTGTNEALQQEAERRYLAWPASQDNVVLRRARERLLGTRSEDRFRTAARQQGLLQIVQDFCLHANALCDGCRFPEHVARLSQSL